jgi:hypothetical protein
MRAEEERRRSVWLTVPLYVFVAAVVVVDVWGAVFWARVGGGLGTAVAAAGAVVAVVLLGFLVTDLRRRRSH